jgi:predicted AlkP superfamily pyrophosphatase or phosphodiesterase
MAWEAGGSAAIFLNDPKDNATRKTVAELLARLKADPANGIREVLEADAIEKMGGFPGAAFVVDAQPDWSFTTALSGPIVEAVKTGGAHGYLPTRPELRAAFFAEGPGIAHGKNLGLVDMRQIAPTVARELGVTLPAAKMPPLPLRQGF